MGGAYAVDSRTWALRSIGGSNESDALSSMMFGVAAVVGETIIVRTIFTLFRDPTSICWSSNFAAPMIISDRIFIKLRLYYCYDVCDFRIE